MRTVVFGGPRCGKTTACNALSGVRHTDDLIATHEWSEVSDLVSTWFNDPGPWVIEGVACGRALRKWLATNPTGKPCDQLRWMGQPKVGLSKGQQAMLKSCLTVFAEIRPELVKRGVEVQWA